MNKYSKLPEVNKQCLALLRAILFSSRQNVNRTADWVNIFIPFTTATGRKELHISLSLEKYWDILEYLEMEIKHVSIK